MIEHIINIIAPHSCIACGKEGLPWCLSCQNSAPSPPTHCYRCHRATSPGDMLCAECIHHSPLASVKAATAYISVPKDSIYALKFARNRAMAACIAHTLSTVERPSDISLITYVPTATSRVRVRGYDQAAAIAKEISVLLGAPYCPALDRIDQRRQVGSSRAQRKSQLSSSFRVRQPYMIATKSIILIDDVLTTGSTLEACATELRRHGAKSVHGRVFAAA